MTIARILVVDDDARVREGVSLGLRLSGYVVDTAASGSEALALLVETRYDLAVLDMQMPEMDGVTLMRRARDIDPDLMIVILTGHATLESAIAAVKTGAADYLLKPASIRELNEVIAATLASRGARLAQEQALTTIREVLRDLSSPTASTPAAASTGSPDLAMVRAGPMILDPRKRTVTVAPASGGPGQHVSELTEGEANLLRTLMAHPGEVLSAQDLVRLAWGYELEEAAAVSAVRSCVYRLRQKLQPTPDAATLIRTVRGGGYYLDI